MLYYRTISIETLELLKKIRNIEIFADLRLVGGTSLALQLGHRSSIDLDFFGSIKCDKLDILNELKRLGRVQLISETENINIYTINNIKVDIINYDYPWLYGRISEDNLSLADIRDIAAMKLAAISGRGTKKDFIDIYFLLKKYTLAQLLSFYEKKYDDGSEFLVLKSLSYFNDAEEDVSPKMFIPVVWNDIKNSIMAYVDEFVNNTGKARK